jgi:hypothetical protein
MGRQRKDPADVTAVRRKAALVRWKKERAAAKAKKKEKKTR